MRKKIECERIFCKHFDETIKNNCMDGRFDHHSEDECFESRKFTRSRENEIPPDPPPQHPNGKNPNTIYVEKEIAMHNKILDAHRIKYDKDDIEYVRIAEKECMFMGCANFDESEKGNCVRGLLPTTTGCENNESDRIPKGETGEIKSETLEYNPIENPQFIKLNDRTETIIKIEDIHEIIKYKTSGICINENVSVCLFDSTKERNNEYERVWNILSKVNQL